MNAETDLGLADAADRAANEQEDHALLDDPALSPVVEPALVTGPLIERVSPFDDLLAAKAARDHVREQIVRTLRAAGTLSPELDALLRADEHTTAAFALALHEHTSIQIPDFHSQH